MIDRADALELALAGRLKARRTEKSLSLDNLAQAAGLHRTSLGLVERGARGLSISAAARLAAALDVQLSELIAEAERAALE